MVFRNVRGRIMESQLEVMKRFLEPLHEIVYMADMDTYELYYMNGQARRCFGLEPDEPLEGEKCYALLQGRDTPCPFCTNDKLQCGAFYEWVYYNSALQRHFAVKDTMVQQEDRRIRVELSFDMSTEAQQKNTIRSYESNEQLLNEALRVALSCYDDQEEPVQAFLSYMGGKLGGDRMYIFEGTEGNTVTNTYEWCKPGVESQLANLQAVPWEAVRRWYEAFHRGEHVILYNVEEIREQEPELYQVLQPQAIHSLIACPIVSHDRVMGFFGMDNPPLNNLYHISTILDIMSNFILCMFHRRDLLGRLERMSYYDQLTGALNRHGLARTLEQMEPEESVGILYCDVMGLKHINDTLGHEHGDALLRRAYQFLVERCQGQPVFRLGGDEFMVLCEDVDRLTFNAIVQAVSEQEGRVDMAMGSVWKERVGDSFYALLSQADQEMYDDKHYRRLQGQICRE